jgi:Fibronectin type III domain
VSGTLTFPPGQDRELVSVSVKGDTTVELNESFKMNLSSPSGATLSHAVASGTIIDDDAVVPPAPRSVRATPDNTSAVLQWAPPTSNGGRPIGGYVVTPYVGGAARTPRVFTTPATTQTISELTNGTTYTFDVAATNAVGTGARSAQSAAITVGAPVTPTVKALGTSTQAVVTWNAPANNGFPITSYVVFVYHGGVLQTAETHTLTCTQPCAPATTSTVTGLTNGSLYTFKVEAHNSQGVGPQGATTILVSATPTPPATPGTPTARAGPGFVTVSWAAPADGTATIDNYVIDIYENGVRRSTFVMPWNGTTNTWYAVTAGRAYSYTVQARSAVGAGPKSALSNSATPS